ncbi:MAG TPA: hypothetical protein PK778_02495 [Bacillota bacterium]|nr:hypothetical protein [Bacillota bacterium]
MAKDKTLSAFTKYSFTIEGKDPEYVGKEVKVYDWTSSTKNFDKEITSLKSDKIYKVTYYKNFDAISGGKVVLLVTDIIDKADLPPVYDYTLKVGRTEIPSDNPAVIRVYNPRVEYIENGEIKNIKATADKLTFEVTYYDVVNVEVLFEGIASGVYKETGTGNNKYVKISNFKRVVETTDGGKYVVDIPSDWYFVKITITYVDANDKTSNSVTEGLFKVKL